jgi:DNA-binding response OmpR family regulator
METIMVQDTDATTVEVIATALEMEGYKVCCATTNDNESLLESIRRCRPKLLLLACRLAHYSGKQICHWVKAHFPKLPIIALSCESAIEQQHKDLGFTDYLIKPFGLEQLYQVVNKHLAGRKRKRESLQSA